MTNIVRYLHGRQVTLGSALYDAAYGPGTVVGLSADPAGITVRFGGGRQASYTDAGHTPRFQQATLFWANPVFDIPAAITPQQRNVIAAVVSTLAIQLMGA